MVLGPMGVLSVTKVLLEEKCHLSAERQTVAAWVALSGGEGRKFVCGGGFFFSVLFTTPGAVRSRSRRTGGFDCLLLYYECSHRCFRLYSALDHLKLSWFRCILLHFESFRNSNGYANWRWGKKLTCQDNRFFQVYISFAPQPNPQDEH